MSDIIFGIIIILVNIIIAVAHGSVELVSVFAIACGAFIVGHGVKSLDLRDK